MFGFNLGGSLAVKYLGENIDRLADHVIGGIAFSIPCQLGLCAKKLSEPENQIYLKRFLTKLKNKIKAKAKQFPEIFDLASIDAITIIMNLILNIQPY